MHEWLLTFEKIIEKYLDTGKITHANGKESFKKYLKTVARDVRASWFMNDYWQEPRAN